MVENPGSEPWGGSGALLGPAIGMEGCEALQGVWAFFLVAPEVAPQGLSVGFRVESADLASPPWGVTVVRVLPDVSLRWVLGRATGLGVGSLLLVEGLFELTTWAKVGVTGCSWLVALGHVRYAVFSICRLFMQGTFGLAGGSWLVARGSAWSLQSPIWGLRVRSSRLYTFHARSDTPVKFGCNPSAANTIRGEKCCIAWSR